MTVLVCFLPNFPFLMTASVPTWSYFRLFLQLVSDASTKCYPYMHYLTHCAHYERGCIYLRAPFFHLDWLRFLIFSYQCFSPLQTSHFMQIAVLQNKSWWWYMWSLSILISPFTHCTPPILYNDVWVQSFCAIWMEKTRIFILFFFFWRIV